MRSIALVLPSIVCFGIYAYMMVYDKDGKWAIFTIAVMLAWDGIAAIERKGVGGNDL